jgi:hypothetical protein
LTTISNQFEDYEDTYVEYEDNQDDIKSFKPILRYFGQKEFEAAIQAEEIKDKYCIQYPLEKVFVGGRKKKKKEAKKTHGKKVGL